MAKVTSYVSEDGDILIPMSSSADNSSDLVSLDGTIWIANLYTPLPAIVAGNPMGLLLTLTYSATP